MIPPKHIHYSIHGNEIQVYSSKVFGSSADSTYTEESDFNFCIIVHAAVSDIPAETARAYKSIRKVKRHPMDIVVGTVSRFEARKEIPSIEKEVYKKRGAFV